METQTSKETLSGDVLKAKLREALIAIKKLKKEVADHTGVGHEDIAIVGMACRFPGGIKDLKGYWDLLEGAKNVITEIPKQRWDNDYFYQEEEKKEGKINTKYGGFIDDVELFDNTYFGISPIEAKYMDPQQRLLLEVTCETLEHAGINIQSLQGSDTGVFVGSAANDYSRKHLNSPNNHDISAYSITGGELYAIPGRISYILGLQGPSSLVSTACSSSLVAIHQACQSLLLRESNLALAGGSNLMISPEPYIALSQMGALSVDGQCKAFDAKANGYVRGEGVGMVALKRLSDAEKDGDEILAVIKATAVNQDGKSNGFTAPNVKAQEKLIETALAKCGLDISQIDLIEAHGTGTPLGDPIELQAITNVIKRSAQKREKPLLIGTVKSNFGHTEGAAGVAGLIKMVLAIQHQKVPQSLHFETPNPYYKWDENHIKVPQKTLDWQKDSARVGGISSFGVSGTNAHAIVAEYVPTAAESLPTPETGIHLLPISANSFEAIQAYAAKYAAHFEGIAEKEIYHHTASALYNRTQLKNRVVLAASSKDSLMHKLKELAADRLTIFTAIDAENFEPKVAFVFSGYGSDWIGMGRKLLETEEVFRKYLEACDKIFKKFIDWSILEELNAEEAENKYLDIEVVQPITCAIQIALAALWKSKGIQPEGIVGHSMGEVAAAYTAGALNLEQAAHVICRRTQFMNETKGQGMMGVVGLPREEVQKRVENLEDKISIAVINSPNSTVISGEPTLIKKLLQEFKEEGLFSRALKTDVAFHSTQMDHASNKLQEELKQLQPKGNSIPLYSTVTRELIQGESLTNDYWKRNLRDQVLFSDTIAQMLAEGYNTFIEVSPHPILVNPLKECFETAGEVAVAIPTLYRNSNEFEAFWQAWGTLHAVGYELNWGMVFKAKHQFVSDLPTYPWEHKRFWLETASYQINTADKIATSNQSQSEEGGLSLIELLRKQNSEQGKVHLIKSKVLDELLLASGYERDQVNDTSSFMALGIDSMMAMKIKGRIEKSLNVSFSTAAFWKYNSIHQLAEYLLKEVRQFQEIDQGSDSTLVDVILKQDSQESKLDLIAEGIRYELLNASGYDDNQVDNTTSFTALGIDSMMAMKVKGKLEKALKITFATAAFWKYNSINNLAEYLLQLISESDSIAKEVEELVDKEWFIIPKKNTEAPIQLVCLHGAGENALMYHSWAEAMSDTFEMINVQLPGRGSRMDEKPYLEMNQLIDDLVIVLRKVINRPYLLFGHSMGGLLAFELTRALRKKHDELLPLHLYISATPSYRGQKIQKLSKLSEKELIEKFPDLAEENFPDKEFHRLILNTLKADLTMVDAYEYQEQEALPVPITAIAGDNDEFISLDLLKNWKNETSQEFEFILRDGGSHHYLRTDWKFLIELFAKEVSLKSI